MGGAIWSGIATFLWASRGVNEIISTLMLNFVAIQVLSWVIRGPLKAEGQSLPQTRSIPDSAIWPTIEARGGLNWDLLLIVVLAILVAVMLRSSAFGFRLRASAANEKAARSAGIATVRVRSLAMLISGGIGGLVGAGLILGGQSRVMSDGFNGTFGYDGIAVALVARTSVPAAALTAVLFAALRQGGDLLEAVTGVSSALVEIMQGIIIVLVAGSAVLTRRVELRRVDGTPLPEVAAPSVADAYREGLSDGNLRHRPPRLDRAAHHADPPRRYRRTRVRARGRAQHRARGHDDRRSFLLLLGVPGDRLADHRAAVRTGRRCSSRSGDGVLLYRGGRRPVIVGIGVVVLGLGITSYAGSSVLGGRTRGTSSP